MTEYLLCWEKILSKVIPGIFVIPIADGILERAAIHALKTLDAMPRAAEISLVNHLAATGIDTGRAGNFGRPVTCGGSSEYPKTNPVDLKILLILSH